MAPRDRISEIVEIRKREGRHPASPSKYDLDRLSDVWKQKLKGVDFTDELIPIRIVTILEVSVRGWIEHLVDHGAPYVERAAKLNIDLKFDFAIASSLHGGVVTLGQLIAHSVSISRLESVVNVLGTLLDENLFASISTVHDRWAVEVEGKPDRPIIDDIKQLKRTLFRLFEVRHVLVHEMPRAKPHTVDEVDDFLRSATLFIQAVDEMLDTKLHGKSPLTQGAMNRDAAARGDAAMEELTALCEQIAREYGSTTIHNVQTAWNVFQAAEAKRQSDVYLGGSMQPMIYSAAVESLTRTRIDELKRWIEEGKID
jgi:Lysozyme inhibitor LprI